MPCSSGYGHWPVHAGYVRETLPLKMVLVGFLDLQAGGVVGANVTDGDQVHPDPA